jgi:phospholipid transport system substrate-binding protein
MNGRRSVPVVILALGLTLASSTAGAGPATDQVKASVDRVVGILQDPELRKPAKTAQRRAQIREVARQLFDFEEMSRRVLGRHWGPRSPEERKRFTELFTDLLESTYVSKIESYGGEKIVYLPEQADGGQATVRSKLITEQGTEIPIDYRLHRTGERWAAFDVLVEGVSLVSNYRTQFNRIIAQESYGGLVKRLEQKSREVAEQLKTGKPGGKAP